MTSPFKKKEYKPQPAGYYDVVFMGPGEFARKRREFDKVSKKSILTDEDETAIRLTFAHTFPDGKTWRFQKDFNAYIASKKSVKRSKISQATKLMGGSFATPAVLDNGDKTWDLLNALVGNEYTLQISVSEDRKWNNIEAILPKRDWVISVECDEPQAAPVLPTAESLTAQGVVDESPAAAGVSFDDDDIPF